ncbi:hypothetical protein VP01_8773g1, partial [Puccinia sorghi]
NNSRFSENFSIDPSNSSSHHSKDQILDGEPALDENNNMIICVIILAKLSATTHNNVVTSANEEDAIALWKAILKRFTSTEPSNCARCGAYIGKGVTAGLSSCCH